MKLWNPGCAGLIAAFALCAQFNGAWALHEHHPDDQKDRPHVFGQASLAETEVRGRERVRLDTGVPVAMYDLNYVVEKAEPQAMARQFLAEQKKTFRLADAQTSDLEHAMTRVGRGGTVVRFRQTHEGLPVLGGDMAVTINRFDRISFVTNDYKSDIQLATTTPMFEDIAARTKAHEYLGIQGELNYDVTRLAVYADVTPARLVYQVKVVPREKPNGDWEVLVDAVSGEILKVVDNAAYVDGTGNCFDPDPLSSANAAYGSPGFSDGGDANTAQMTAETFSRTLRDITQVGSTFSLTGPYVSIVDSESPFLGTFSQTSSSWAFQRQDAAFEAAHCYYHLDTFMRYMNETLGIAVAPIAHSGGVRCDPHGLSGADNSHYIPSTNEIAFGEGGVDDAEDADVVIHELGHGIHDWVTGGNLSQVNGLSEGLGDYFCASYSRALGSWPSSAPAHQWTFSWDGHNEFWGGRITNYSASYPGGLVGQIHTDGQIWATCLMKIWDEIGREKTDAAVIEGIAMTGSSSSQDDAAQAVLQAAANMGYTSAEITSIVTNFQNTGYSISLGIDYQAHVPEDDCAGDPLRINGVPEPGEIVTIPVTIQSSAVGHTGVSGVLTTTTPGVTILDDVASFPDLTPGGSQQSNAPHFQIQIDETVACFTEIDFSLTVSSNEGGPFPMAFSQAVGQSITPPGLPISIPDANATGGSSTLSLSSAAILSDVNVRVELTHTWVGDLLIRLQSPSGTTVTLLDRPGVPASGFGCSDNDMNVTFDDAVAFDPEGHCASTTPWFTGSANPTQALSAFNGEAIAGTWTLTVVDNAGGDTGQIVDWELITTPGVGGVCEPCEGATDSPILGQGLAFGLTQNRPNPFGASTRIEYQVPRAADTNLSIFDVSGRLVRELVNGTVAAGVHQASWDGRDASGKPVANGVYFYRLASEGRTELKKLQVLR